MIDIMNDDHIKELLAAAPDDQREEIKKAVDQIRSLAESMNAVSTGHSEIRGQVRDLNSRTGRLQHKLSEALMRAKASRKKFGY